MKKYTKLEKQRKTIQAELDSLKSQKERNRMGQFATPIDLARDILKHASKLTPKKDKINFLDPAFGTGAFFSALNNAFPSELIESATGYEIDQHYGKPANKLWNETILNCHIQDFTKVNAPVKDEDKFNLIICNPPYVRHHHLAEQKSRLKDEALKSANMELSGLSGLYCYFLAIAHRWLKPNGIAGWLIPSEFMDVNYGQEIKKYLLNEVTLLQIHRFDPQNVQFDDALVSSAIVWFTNIKPKTKHNIKFTYGGTIARPAHIKSVSIKDLLNEKKWSRFPLSNVRTENSYPKIKDFFQVKRGIATGNNSFFILSEDEINKRNLPISQFRPILPSPRYLDKTEIIADDTGNPTNIKKLFVLDCKLSINEIERIYPALFTYLQEGIKNGVADRYLCKKRKIWYAQENRPESRFFCTYIGRSDNNKKPFRFILNHSKATVTNSYLILYPTPTLGKQIDLNPALNSQLINAINQITGKAMLDEGRVYGGGMHKLEPKELGNVPAREIAELIP